jgi:branched-chain amino acid transport system substrate-binding protein
MMRFASVVAVALTALGVAACGSSGSGSGNSSSTGPIKVGAWFPLTGPVAASGIPQKDGASAAFNQVNADGGINGRKLDYVAEDNAFDPQQTVQAARRLVGDSKVVAIVGANGTATSAAAFPYVLNQARVPIINTYGGAVDWYKPAKPMLFGYQALYEEQAAAAGAWAAQDGHKNILVIRSDPAAFGAVAKNVAPGAKSVNPNVTVNEQVVKFQTTDYSPVVGAVKAKKPDAVVLILAFPEAAAYLKQAKLQGVDVPAYGYAPTADEGLIKLAGTAAEGYHAISLTRPAMDPSPAMREYRQALAKYAPKEQPSANSAISYAGAKAFATVLKHVKGPVTPESITKAFESAGTIATGILPPLKWSGQSHLGTEQVQRVTVQGGKFVAVGGFITPPTVAGL